MFARLHQPCGVHLKPPEVGGFCSMASPILIVSPVPRSPLVVGRVQQILKVRHQEKIVDKIGTESTSGKDGGTELLETGATLLVKCITTHNQLCDSRFGDAERRR